MSVSELVRTSWSSFISWHLHDYEGTGECVMDFVCRWRDSGEGVRACNGDWATYMTAVFGIVVRHSRNAERAAELDAEYAAELDDEDHDADNALPVMDEKGFDHDAFDQYKFEKAVYAYEHPHTEERVRANGALPW